MKTENIRNSYSLYLLQDANAIDIKTYLLIAYGFIKFLMRKVWEGYDVHLSGGNSLGVLCIRGNKVTPYIDYKGDVKGLPVSWAKTKQLWDSNPVAKESKTLVYCFNEHTNGARYAYRWLTKDMKLVNKTIYGLSMSRANKRAVSRLAHSGKEYQMVAKQKY